MKSLNIKALLNKNNLRQYYKWNFKGQIAAGIVVFISVLACGVLLILSNQYTSLNKVKDRENVLKIEYSDKLKQAVNLDLYKLQLVEITEASDALLKQLPNKSEVEKLLIDINEAGLGRGLTFDLFKPGKETVSEYYAELPISIKVNGSYNAIGSFAADVSKLSRVVILKDINLSVMPSNEDKLVMTATAQTFRYLDQEEISKQQDEKRAKNAKNTKSKAKTTKATTKKPAGSK